jgi:hypothetical protein
MKTSAQENRDVQSAMAMRRFYEELDRFLKRHRPDDYAPFAAERLWQTMAEMDEGDPRKFSQTPPHRILHSIEANCAYWRRQNHDPVDLACLGRAMKVYHDHLDPLQMGILEDCEKGKADIQNFFLVMWREQMELQYRHSLEDVARVWQLFVAGDPIPTVSEWFAHTYGLSIAEWMQLCFVCQAAAKKSRGGYFPRSTVAAFRPFEGKSGAVDAFFQHSSLKPEEVSRRFRENRQRVAPQFHSLIRSVFLEYPLLDFGQQRLLAPHPQLLLRHSGEGLYRLAASSPAFGKEFGKSFQRYVGMVLGHHCGQQALYSDQRLQEICRGRHCDFLLALADEIWLVECKATTLTAQILMENAVLNNGSTEKVADGMVQLYCTASDIHNGVFKELALGEGKPLWGIVVTFGELPLANSDWYYNLFVRRAGNDLAPPIYPSNALPQNPIVLSVHVLEQLVAYINAAGTSLRDLYNDKRQQRYVDVGDWDTYLRKKARELNTKVKPLPFVVKQSKQLLRSMGATESTSRFLRIPDGDAATYEGRDGKRS